MYIMYWWQERSKGCERKTATGLLIYIPGQPLINPSTRPPCITVLYPIYRNPKPPPLSPLVASQTFCLFVRHRSYRRLSIIRRTVVLPFSRPSLSPLHPRRDPPTPGPIHRAPPSQCYLSRGRGVKIHFTRNTDRKNKNPALHNTIVFTRRS